MEFVSLDETDAAVVALAASVEELVLEFPPTVSKGLGLKTCFFDMIRTREPIGDLRMLRGVTLAIDLHAWVADAQGAMFHENPSLRFVLASSLLLIRRGVRLIMVMAADAPKRVQECLPLLAALGISSLTVPVGTKPLAVCAAVEAAGEADGVVTSSPEVYLYGARNVFKAASYSSLKDGRFFQHRTEELHPVLSVKGRPQLTHERVLAFAALVGCDRSPKTGVRLSPARAVRLIERAGPSPLATVAAWAEACGEPPPLTAEQLDEYQSPAEKLRGMCSRITAPRRPNLELLLAMHQQSPVVGRRIDAQRTHVLTPALRADCLRLLARLEVIMPGLLPPHRIPSAQLERVLEASRVTPVGYAKTTFGDRSELEELPFGEPLVRVLWKVSREGSGAHERFSTLESKQAFEAVYPMFKPSTYPTTYRVRGFLGL